MSAYKKVRKNWMKTLSKEQKKQFKVYVRDIADEMLEAYAETIRLKDNAKRYASLCLPIANTKKEISVTIELESVFEPFKTKEPKLNEEEINND